MNISNLKKYILILLMLYTAHVFAIEVNRNFIEQDRDFTVEFENYVGPYLFYNSVAEIRNIGSELAEQISPETKGDANYSNKYLIKHRPLLEIEEGVNSCDIFEITDSALIDNIANIELIISQYLIDNYGYTIDDADLLAHLLVIYNAVIRGDTEHIKEFYTSEAAVTGNSDYIGLDIQYFNWPGKTLIYIPLSNNIEFGQLDTIDSDILTEDEVIQSIKLNDDNDIEFREDIVEFKEREFDESVEKIETLEQELEELVDQSNQISDDSTVQNSDSVIDGDPDEIETKIKEKKEQLELEKKDVIEDEEKILELRDELSEDKNSLITEKENKSYKDTFPFILNREVDGEIRGQIVLVSKEGEILERSRVNSIRNSSYIKSGDYIYAIAGGDGANQYITLGKFEYETLSILFWAEISCYEKSKVLISDKNIYAVVEDKGKFYIGEFDQDLNYISRSSVEVSKESYIHLEGKAIYIQGEYNSIEKLNISEFIKIEDKE